MRRLALIGGLLAAFDAGVMAWPLGPGVPDGGETPVAPAKAAVVQRAADRSEREAGWVAAVLARPLFEPGRRAPEQDTVVVAQAERLPRLTGIVVSASTRRALFAAPGEAARGEGERLGSFTVTSIRADAVEVAGPQGVRTLYPADDAGFRAGLAAARALVALERSWLRLTHL